MKILQIHIGNDCQEVVILAHRRADHLSEWDDKIHLYKQDAIDLFQTIIQDLPGGTYDELCAQLRAYWKADSNPVLDKSEIKDFEVIEYETAMLLHPITPEAYDWVEEHIPDHAEWSGNSVIVEQADIKGTLIELTKSGLSFSVCPVMGK